MHLGGTTPLCITYHRTPAPPKFTRTRRFVGFRRMLRNAVGVVSDLIETIAFETSESFELPDGATAVHWAVEIDDPWGLSPESQLVAVRVPEQPPAGTTFEVFRLVTPQVNGADANLKNRVNSAIKARGLYDPEAGYEDL